MQEQLEELAHGWDVTITVATGGNYCVMLVPHGQTSAAYRHLYSDPSLARAVSRAWAGERADERFPR